MIRKICYTVAICFTIGVACCQELTTFPFSIRGEVNIDTGTVRLTRVASGTLYPPGIVDNEAAIVDGKFVLSGNTPTPIAVYIEVGEMYYSPPYLISEGEQAVKIDVNRNREFVSVATNRYDEEKRLYDHMISNVSPNELKEFLENRLGLQ